MSAALQEFRALLDSTGFGVEKQKESDHDTEIELKQRSSGSNKVLEKRKSIGTGAVLLVIVGLLVAVYWGFRK